MVVSGIMKFYRQRHDKREWMYGHIGGFLGGYIATVSAFSAVNLTMIKPIWLQWLWPTIIGVPLIFLTIWRLKRRFVKGERLRSFADVRIK
jgi:fluoride ion exporter CrcB/FEX